MLSYVKNITENTSFTEQEHQKVVPDPAQLWALPFKVHCWRWRSSINPQTYFQPKGL